MAGQRKHIRATGVAHRNRNTEDSPRLILHSHVQNRRPAGANRNHPHVARTDARTHGHHHTERTGIGRTDDKLLRPRADHGADTPLGKAAAHHRPHGGTRNKNPRGKHPRKRCHDERFHSHQRWQSARTGTDNNPRRNFRLHQDKLYHENEHGSRLTETLLHRMVCPRHRNGERAGMRQKRQNHGTGRAGADAPSLRYSPDSYDTDGSGALLMAPLPLLELVIKPFSHDFQQSALLN